ncbi:hypothetical protein [Propioniferax innocua]|uniref:NHLP leader peptide family natural product n=1 Tax=Propioniferax innocua TaxID=1753 RepID=A0A542ZAI3_9ACTN|nr:hypothetical protein [Propioniferax innocua]TQL57325.1 hypothetical protein FB460_2402 [Propioniferax innocua]
MIAEEEFIRLYAAVLVQFWSDDDYAEKLRDSPRDALAEKGLIVPESADVTISFEPSTTASPEPEATKLREHYQAWVEGHTNGVCRLVIPNVPQIPSSPLDVSELSQINVAGHCCCCPCCCSI